MFSKIIISIALILIITFLSFYPSLKNNFTNWDDDVNVINNRFIKDLSIKGITRIFTAPQWSLYAPLVYLSFAIEYNFFKLNPVIYHTVNLTLHLINCLLVFILIFTLTRNYQVASIVSLLFGIHPLHVESVAWVSERKNVLYAFFFLGAMISYVYYLLEKRTSKYYYLSLILFILSLLSKAMAVTLPAILLLIDYLLRRKRDKTMITDKIPFFILSFIFYVMAMHILYSSEVFRNNKSAFNLLNKSAIDSYSIIFYLSKIFIPVRLSCLYPYPMQHVNLLPPIFLISPLLLALMTIAVIASVRYTKKITFGFFFFLINILPALQLVTYFPAIAADRYAYVPSIGIFYIMGEFLVWLYDKKLTGKFIKLLFLAFLFFIAAILSFLTWDRCKIWKDGVTLWSDALNKYNRSAIIFNHRGVAYSDRGEHDKAISDYNQALKIDPYFAVPHNNLGVSLLNKKEYDKAEAEFIKALQIDPSYSEAHYNLAMTYGIVGKHKEAVTFAKRAIETNPGYARAYAVLAAAYGGLGNFREAIKTCKKALELDSGLGIAYYNLAVAYLYSKQDYDKAWDNVHKAKELGVEVKPQFLEDLKKASGRER